MAGAGAGGKGAAGNAGAAPGGAGIGGIPGNGGNGRPGAGAAGALFFLPFLRPTWFTSKPVDGSAVLNLTSRSGDEKQSFQRNDFRYAMTFAQPLRTKNVAPASWISNWSPLALSYTLSPNWAIESSTVISTVNMS